MEYNLRDKYPDNLVWRHFTPEEMPFAKCILCKKPIRATLTSLSHVENHLMTQHPEEVKNIKEEIQRTWLSQYFIFEDIHRIKCTKCNRSFNMFHGVNKMEDHLKINHKTNASTSAHDEPADAHSQIADQEGYQRMGDNYVWYYVTPLQAPFVRCNHCGRVVSCSRESLDNIEMHLALNHPEVIQEIQEKIESIWIGRYFIFLGTHNIICLNCMDPINMFNGIHYMERHLESHGLLKYTMTYTRMQGSNINVSVQQSVAQEDNASTSAHDEPADAHSQSAN